MKILAEVYRTLSDGRPRTLVEIQEDLSRREIFAGEASISARIRELRSQCGIAVNRIRREGSHAPAYQVALQGGEP